MSQKDFEAGRVLGEAARLNMEINRAIREMRERTANRWRKDSDKNDDIAASVEAARQAARVKLENRWRVDAANGADAQDIAVEAARKAARVKLENGWREG